MLHFNKVEQGFSAVLKTPDGEILEYGKASIAPDHQGIVFKNDFVPLFKMGTPLVIVRTQGDLETQRFTGEVYLSSQNLLQLVSVTDEVLSGAAAAFLYDTCLPAELTASLTQEPPKHFLARLLHPHPKTQVCTVPVTITAISLTHLRLSGNVELGASQRFTVEIPQLSITKLPAQVELVLDFGQDGVTKNYKCKILELGGANRLQLAPFVETLSQQANKMFPPIS